MAWHSSQVKETEEMSIDLNVLSAPLLYMVGIGDRLSFWFTVL